jgi:hypothetical protein
MRRQVHVAALSIVIGVLAVPIALRGAPSSAPISVEYSAPPPMKTGDETNTVLGFHALADLQRLEVTVYSAGGVAVVSQPTQAVFTDVKKGDAPQLTVRVRLTGAKWGALAVLYKTVTPTQTASNVITIDYGDPSQ